METGCGVEIEASSFSSLSGAFLAYKEYHCTVAQLLCSHILPSIPEHSAKWRPCPRRRRVSSRRDRELCNTASQLRLLLVSYKERFGFALDRERK